LKTFKEIKSEIKIINIRIDEERKKHDFIIGSHRNELSWWEGYHQCLLDVREKILERKKKVDDGKFQKELNSLGEQQ